MRKGLAAQDEFEFTSQELLKLHLVAPQSSHAAASSQSVGGCLLRAGFQLHVLNPQVKALAASCYAAD